MDFHIASLDRSLAQAVQAKIDAKTKPLGSLGRLEDLALQIALIQQSLAPKLEAPHLLLFAGDHGAAADGLSAYPQDVTWQMVLNFLRGGAAINVFARQHGLAVRVVDAGVAHDFDPHPSLINAKIAHGTRNFIHEAAMTSEQRDEAVARGAALCRQCLNDGANVVACGDMGIGNTSAASLLMHRITDLPLQECIGRGTGLDDKGVERKTKLLAQASARKPGKLSAADALAEFGGFEIAMMVGAILAAAEANAVVIVDGFITTAALLVAAALYPACVDRCVFAHQSAERGHRLALDRLGASPLLALDMRLGEGVGAAVAYPLLLSAVCFLNEMSSFVDAAVAEKINP